MDSMFWCQVFRIRCDASLDWSDTPLWLSTDGVEGLGRGQLPLPGYGSSGDVLDALDEAYTYARSNYLVFGVPSLSLDMALLQTAIDLSEGVRPVRMPLRPVYDGAAYGQPFAGYPLELMLTGVVWPREVLQRFVLACRAAQDAGAGHVQRCLVALLEQEATVLEGLGLDCVAPLRHEEMADRAIALLQANRPVDALALLQQLRLSSSGKNKGLGYLRALCKLQRNRVEEAQAHLEAELLLHPDSPQCWDLLKIVLPLVLAQPDSYAALRPALATITGYLSGDQERFLYETVRSLPEDACILEIGGCYGLSTAIMAFACVGTRRRIWTIDTFCGNDGAMGRNENFLDVWTGNLARFDLDRYVTPLPGFSGPLLRAGIGLPPLDFIFIDGSHEFEDVYDDFMRCYPLAKDGGIIALHDVEPGWPGAWRAWRQTAAKVLADHVIVGSLASGRKVPGKPCEEQDWAWRGYGLEWADELAERDGAWRGLSALLGSVVTSDGTASSHNPDIARALATLPALLRTELHNIATKDGARDALVWFWLALCHKGQGNMVAAADAFEQSARLRASS